MSFSPRRWFQFRITTWFVLVAILVWAMMQGEWYYDTIEEGYLISGPNRGIQVSLVRKYNSALIYPALALAAFVGWKAAWAIGRRVRTGGRP